MPSNGRSASLGPRKAMQAVILAGGLATRLRPLTEALPKSMIAICGKPFLEYQIELLYQSGVRDIVLCVGYLAEAIRSYFDDGSRFGVRLRYSREGNELLGTGGALRRALPLLDERFLVMYGDSYLMIDYCDLIQKFLISKLPGMMVVHRNKDRWDRSNVVVRNAKVAFYSKTERIPETVYIDAGVTAFRRTAVKNLPEGREVDLQVLLGDLCARSQLAAYETQQRFYEIGSAAGLKEFEALMNGARGNATSIAKSPA